MHNAFIRYFAIFLFAVIPVSTPAYALDSNAFINALKAFIEADGAEFEYKRTEETDDGHLQIHGVEIVHEEREESLEIELLVFENPEQTNGGGISYDGISAKVTVIEGDDGGKTEIAELTGNDLAFSDAPDSDPFPEKIGTLTLTDITMTPPDSEGSINIPSISASNYERTGARTFLLGSAEVAPFQGRIFTDDDEPVDISSDGMSVVNVEHFGNFGVSIEALDVGGVNINTAHEGGPVSLSFEGMEVRNYYAWDGIDETRPMIPDKDVSVSIFPFELKMSGKKVFGWDGVEAFADNDQENKISTSTASFNNLTFDFTALPLEGSDKRNIQNLIDLGYEKITASMAMGGYFDLKNGVLEIGKMAFDITDAGSFDMKFRVNGYTEEVARAVAKLGRDIGAESDAQLQQEKSMQMLATLTPLSLEDLEITVKDNSLLGKVVSLQAARLQQEPEQVAGIVAPMAGIMLAPFNIPEFAASVSQALSVFMQGNKSISARMEPGGGLAITEIIALGSGFQAGRIQPKDLLDRLNLTISAE